MTLVDGVCSPEEAQTIAEQAAQAGLSVSDFVRRMALQYQVPTRKDAQAMQDLRRVNADLARLGNLLKIAMDLGDEKEVTSLLLQIKDTQAELKKAALHLIEINSAN